MDERETQEFDGPSPGDVTYILGCESQVLNLIVCQVEAGNFSSAVAALSESRKLLRKADAILNRMINIRERNLLAESRN